MDGRLLLIYLSQLPGVGWKTISKLENYFSSFQELFSKNPLELSMEGEIDYKLAEKIVTELDQAKVKMFQSKLKEWESRNIKIISYLDENYPKILKEIAQPPWVIYALGDLDLLQQYSFAIVGTRNPTNYGKMVTEKLAKELAELGFVIISGLARGVDTIAHEGAINNNGKTVAVLGSGIDIIYPKENKKIYHSIVEKGLVLSEYPPGTEPRPGLFPQRNRIISGLTLGTLVIEASQKSGSLITAQHALEQSREVFAIPGPITSKQSIGSNSLIKQGAKLVQCIEDIIEEYSYLTLEERNKVIEEIQLNHMEQKILSAISNTPIHIDEIFELMKMSLPDIYEGLLSLQLKKKIKQLPGNVYIRNL